MRLKADLHLCALCAANKRPIISKSKHCAIFFCSSYKQYYFIVSKAFKTIGHLVRCAQSAQVEIRLYFRLLAALTDKYPSRGCLSDSIWVSRLAENWLTKWRVNYWCEWNLYHFNITHQELGKLQWFCRTTASAWKITFEAVRQTLTLYCVERSAARLALLMLTRIS